MQREIKFRGWDGKTMFDISQITFNDGTWDLSKGRGVSIPFQSHITLMQFTGQEDAQINGLEVWESDIIENCDTKLLQVVYWNNEKSAWYCRYLNDPKRVLSLADSLGNFNKVIGNIYENPELI